MALSLPMDRQVVARPSRWKVTILLEMDNQRLKTNSMSLERKRWRPRINPKT